MSTVDGDEIDSVTFGGDDIQEITVDGDVVWEALDVVEGFEHNDIAGEYGNETGAYTTTTSAVYEGTYALTTTTTSVDTIVRQDTTNAPARGETFGARIFAPSDRAGIFHLFFASESWEFLGNEGYVARIEHGTANEQIYIWKRTSSGWDHIADEFWDATGAGNQWNTLEVDFGDSWSSDITVTYYEGDYGTTLAGPITASDTSYDSGHYGFSIGDDTGGVIDQLHK